MTHRFIAAVRTRERQRAGLRGIYRAGRFWPDAGTVVASGDLKDADWKRLMDEPLLHIREATAEEIEAAAAGASETTTPETVIDEEVAVFLARLLLARYPQRIADRYKLDVSKLDGVGVVEGVARRRGCLVKGGGPDLEKAALILLNDFRSGALGPISLETPQTRAAMLAAAEQAAAAGSAS